jgi:thiosulfate/3-mercaptopyruvate sulfurtransferase
MAAISPVVIDAKTLATELNPSAGSAASPTEKALSITLLDVRSAEEYASGHIAGAHHLPPTAINRSEPPASGLLPQPEDVATWTSQLGISPNTHVVVYDAGKATAAARALWVLNTYGFNHVSWLNGGLNAWQAAGYATTTDLAPAPAALPTPTLSPNPSMVLNNEQLINNFSVQPSDTARRLPIDARSAEEYAGTDKRSERGGHMPGAVHFDWRDMLAEDGTFKADDELRAALNTRNVNPDRPTVVYCQTHQRSAMTYVVLKHLGFNDVAALDGAWSSWGNDPKTPIEQ